MYRIAWMCISVGLWLTSCRQKENAAVLPYYNSPDFTPLFLSDADSIRAKVTHTISNFRFTDQNGKPFGSRELKGKIHVAIS